MVSSQRDNRDQSKRKFIGVPELCERWNGCSHMFIERKIKNDPDFPKVYRFSRHRLFDLDEVEAYEQKFITRGEKSHAKSRRS
jgi:hypothetical protein